MKMDKSLVHLLVLFLGFSYVISSVVAVPTTRSLKPIKENPAVTNLEAQKMGEGEILVVEGLVEKRMVLSTDDYPGTGANNNHDPKTPGQEINS